MSAENTVRIIKNLKQILDASLIPGHLHPYLAEAQSYLDTVTATLEAAKPEKTEESKEAQGEQAT